MKALNSRLDRALAERLNMLVARVDKLSEARGAYLLKKAEQDTFEKRLIKAAEGKSQAEKTMNAQVTDEWLNFQRELATLFNRMKDEELIHDILDKAYLAEHLSAKLDADTIKRQGA